MAINHTDNQIYELQDRAEASINSAIERLDMLIAQGRSAISEDAEEGILDYFASRVAAINLGIDISRYDQESKRKIGRLKYRFLSSQLRTRAEVMCAKEEHERTCREILLGKGTGELNLPII